MEEKRDEIFIVRRAEGRKEGSEPSATVESKERPDTFSYRTKVSLARAPSTQFTHFYTGGKDPPETPTMQEPPSMLADNNTGGDCSN